MKQKTVMVLVTGIVAVMAIYLGASPWNKLAADFGGQCSDLNRNILDRSLDLGIEFLLANQKEAGKFLLRI